MSRMRLSELKKRILGCVASTSLLSIPVVFALSQAPAGADFSLFSTLASNESDRFSVQERARKKLIRVKQTAQRMIADEDTVSTETPTTMIAQDDAWSDADEIDLFPIVLAAPSQ